MSLPAVAEEDCAGPAAAAAAARSPYRMLMRSISDEPTSESPYATGYRRVSISAALHRADPPPKYATSLCSAAFLLKLLQLVLTTAAAALLAEGNGLLHVPASPKLIFPHVTYTAYIVIPSVIVLSYLLGQKMHEMLIRLVLAVGIVMHVSAAVCAGAELRPNWEQWSEGSLHLGRWLWVLEALMALAAAAVQAADLATSITLSYRRAASV
ncbi:uncharacterized protein LOC126457461 [Schistocerca serialis cubense]|uniref:uncharacterized protein LOC126457461 n=1 Tax=Schistocerca serialis cubense TaxID=2023355 RepID=UPI00214E5532|nr:uncharacterized protein LOC126457461 [Schistocerca serialis cubense]